MADTKKYWRDIVEPDDIDAHMIEVGQASVNAFLIKDMLTQYPLPIGSTLYVPGCGTGQMFDFVKPADLGTLKYLFADIKPEFLQKLKTRLPAGVDCEIILDDLEESKIKQKVEAALVVLLLQHIDWKLALKNILVTNPEKLFLIEQEQDAKDSEINKTRQLRPSMKKFSEVAKTELLDRSELENYLSQRGYSMKWTKIESVPHTKRMVALVFNKTDR